METDNWFINCFNVMIILSFRGGLWWFPSLTDSLLIMRKSFHCSIIHFFFLYNIKIIFIQLYWKHTHLIIWWVSPTLSSLDQKFHISKCQAWIIILVFHDHCCYDNNQRCSFAGQINISRHYTSCDLLHFLLSELERQQAIRQPWVTQIQRQAI